MPEPDCCLRYRMRMRCNAEFSYVGKIPRIAITASRGNNFVGGTCAPPRALLVCSFVRTRHIHASQVFYQFVWRIRHKVTLTSFLWRDAMQKRGLTRRAVAGRLQDVCLSATFVYRVETALDTAVVATECE